MRIFIIYFFISLSSLAISAPRDNDNKVISIPFKFDNNTLALSNVTELNKISNLVESDPTLKIIVTGHTDNVGDEKYNDKLGLERASAAANYLEQRFGISKNNIIVESRGELDPIASNDTDKGRQLNRRIDIYYQHFRINVK